VGYCDAEISNSLICSKLVSQLLETTLFQNGSLAFRSPAGSNLCLKLESESRVTLRLAVYRQSVRLGTKPLETHGQNSTWRARSPYLYPPGTRWPSYTPRHWVPFLLPFTNRRVMVEVVQTLLHTLEGQSAMP
jgi:hypothetical protein